MSHRPARTYAPLPGAPSYGVPSFPAGCFDDPGDRYHDERAEARVCDDRHDLEAPPSRREIERDERGAW